MLYYLFSAHHWPLSELRALWEGETAWHDVVLALASYEANTKKPPGTRSKKTVVPVAKK